MAILSRAAPPKPVAERFIKGLLVGPSKTGKTTSSMTLPGKKLLIDTDLRSDSIVGFPDVDVIQISYVERDLKKGWSECENLVSELWVEAKKPKFPYDSIIFDGLSSLRRLCMGYCLTLTGSGAQKLTTSPGGGPSQAHYGPHIHLTEKLINRALPLPCNVVFTGHFYNFEDETTNKMEWFPNVHGRGLRNEIGSWFNECYITSRRLKKYQWQTLPDSKFTFAGSSINKLGKIWQDPVIIDFDAPPIGFAKIIAMREEAEKGEKPDVTLRNPHEDSKAHRSRSVEAQLVPKEN